MGRRIRRHTTIVSRRLLIGSASHYQHAQETASYLARQFTSDVSPTPVQMVRALSPNSWTETLEDILLEAGDLWRYMRIRGQIYWLAQAGLSFACLLPITRKRRCGRKRSPR